MYERIASYMRYRMGHKDIFIDLKHNALGLYLKISERNEKSRSTILIPASGIDKLITTLQEVNALAKSDSAGSDVM